MMDDTTLCALIYRQAKRKIMRWALDAHPSPARLINYVLYD